MIAALITQHRGEYVLRIGEQPQQNHLFAGDLSEESGDWSGIPRTENDLDYLKDVITKTVEEVGGKVRRFSSSISVGYFNNRARHPFFLKRGRGITEYPYF